MIKRDFLIGGHFDVNLSSILLVIKLRQLAYKKTERNQEKEPDDVKKKK